MSTPEHDDRAEDTEVAPSDQGGILVFVLVLVVIGALLAVPLLAYTSTVLKAGKVTQGKSIAVEQAQGGIWVALSDPQLFDRCSTSGATVPSELAGVAVTCETLEDERRRPPSEIPFGVATTQANVTVPSEFSDGTEYENPAATDTSIAYDRDFGTAPVWTAASAQGAVWLPELSERLTTSGRRTAIEAGAVAPPYATCEVYFPGTYSSEIVLDKPAFFTSGVYYFTEPIILRDGADVVAGNGTAAGCSTDLQAPVASVNPPRPLNMSGLGATFVFGEDARLVVDDAGTGTIRFVMNQRYVADTETAVTASESVSIVSVNGAHSPFVGAAVLGDPLDVPGVIYMPASRVAGEVASTPAIDSGYLPSVLSPSPTRPEAATGVVVEDYRVDDDFDPRAGRFTVSWDVPNENGSRITGYLVTASTGETCSPRVPLNPAVAVQPSCTLAEFEDGDHPTVTVTATNAIGTSDPSVPVSSSDPIDLVDSGRSSAIESKKPSNVDLGAVYGDGIEITWKQPGDNGGSPITHYRVTATDVLGVVGDVTCIGEWTETSCVLTTANGLVPETTYDIAVVSIQNDDGTDVESAEDLLNNVFVTELPLGSPAVQLVGGPTPPPAPPAPPQPRVPEPILDLSQELDSPVQIRIAGYVAVPQGRIEISASREDDMDVRLIGGVVAGDVWIDPSGVPDTLQAQFSNPIGQKRVRLLSVAGGEPSARAEAIVQVNQSGSLAINSWSVQ